MSFLSGNTSNFAQPEQKPLGMDAGRLSTDEAARPLPVLWGTRRIGVTFVSNAFNQKVEAVTQELGKEDTIVGYNYFADWAGLVCHGPVSALHAIYLDDELVWPLGEEAEPRVRKTDSYSVLRVDVTEGGEGYADGLLPVALLGGSGTGAAARAVVVGGAVQYILMTSFGTGYLEDDDITFSIPRSDDEEPDDPENPKPPKCQAVAVLGWEPCADLTIEGFGQWRIWWGDNEQEFDPHLLTLSSDIAMNPAGVTEPNVAEEHPAYAGQCYIRAKSHFLGYNRQQLQNVEVVVSRQAAVGADANVAGLIVDGLTNTRFGLGIHSNRLDTAGIEAVAAQLAEGDLGISPIVNRAQPFRQFLVQALEYVDGWHTTTDAGKFTLGLTRGLPCDEEMPGIVLDEECLAGEPEISVSGWTGTRNLVWVKFTNAEAAYKEDSVAGRNAGNYLVTLEPGTVSLDRLWVTRPSTANRIAYGMTLHLGHETTKGTLAVRKSKLQGLKAGGVFWLKAGAWGLCWMACRCLRIETGDPYAPEATVSFEKDKGFFLEGAVPLPLAPPPVKIVQPVETITAEMSHVLESPWGNAVTGAPYAIALAGRPTPTTSRYLVHAAISESSYKQVGGIDRFVTVAQLFLAYAKTNAGALHFVVTSENLGFPEGSDLSEAQAQNNEWLLLIGDEIMAFWGAELEDDDEITGGAEVYRVNVLRERMDSMLFDHAENARIFIVRKADVGQLSFTTLREAPVGQEEMFKFQPITLGSPLKLAECPVITTPTFQWTNRANRPWKQSAFTAPATWSVAGGNVEFSWKHNNKTGGPFTVRWDGIAYIIDIRRAGEDFDYTLALPEATGSRRFARQIPQSTGDTQTWSISPGDLATALGGAQDFVVRMWTRQNGLNSRHFDERTVALA